MSSEISEKLRRKRVGEIPLLLTMAQRLGFRELLMRYLKAHGNEKIPAADTLLLLVFNIASGRQPLYELEHYADFWIMPSQTDFRQPFKNGHWDSLENQSTPQSWWIL